MKILEEKYPKGTLPRQKSDGRYIDATLFENLKIPAKKVVEDHSFLGILSSSTLEVGTGKSVLAQQIGEAWTHLINTFHGDKLKEPIDFTTHNITFRPKDLIERSFQVPRYSCIILDEWEDAHFWSELGMSLRQFFRKCRQLNLFILIIIPNFFQLPLQYAISRSIFFIDVKFEEDLDRGYFDFYSFKRKKELYIKGKKFHNYDVIKPSFSGRFADGYAVDEQKYRRAKYLDMLKSEKEENKSVKFQEKQHTIKLFRQIYQNLDKVTIKELSLAFGVSERTGQRYVSDEYDKDGEKKNPETDNQTDYNNILINREDNPEPTTQPEETNNQNEMQDM